MLHVSQAQTSCTEKDLGGKPPSCECRPDRQRWLEVIEIVSEELLMWAGTSNTEHVGYCPAESDLLIVG